jgi:hypothetical protein
MRTVPWRDSEPLVGLGMHRTCAIGRLVKPGPTQRTMAAALRFPSLFDQAVQSRLDRLSR